MAHQSNDLIDVKCPAAGSSKILNKTFGESKKELTFDVDPAVVARR